MKFFRTQMQGLLARLILVFLVFSSRLMWQPSRGWCCRTSALDISWLTEWRTNALPFFGFQNFMSFQSKHVSLGSLFLTQGYGINCLNNALAWCLLLIFSSMYFSRFKNLAQLFLLSQILFSQQTYLQSSNFSKHLLHISVCTAIRLHFAFEVICNNAWLSFEKFWK